jgi:transposase InsO family protein
MELRDAVPKIALEWPAYGRRRVTAELKRRGWQVNHKRVHRIMREGNLLCVWRRKFLLTTDSNHSRPVYPNVAADMERTGTDQLWVADITYIRLQTEFVYLPVVLDAHSCRVIGWPLDRNIDVGLPPAALRMAPSGSVFRHDGSIVPLCHYFCLPLVGRVPLSGRAAARI